MSYENFMPVGKAIEKIAIGDQLEANPAKLQVRKLRVDTIDRISIAPASKNWRDKEWVYLIWKTIGPDFPSKGGKVLHGVHYDQDKAALIAKGLWEKRTNGPGALMSVEVEAEELIR